MKTNRRQDLRETPESMGEIRRVLSGAVDRGAADSIRPFFVDRVMKSIAVPQNVRVAGEELFEALVGWFRPVALASLIISLTLVGFNLKSASEFEIAATVSESVLGLPRVSVESAYELIDESP